METEVISLRVPARPEYARTVRMMASNLAVVCGMNVDDVEDVRMAAEEGFVYACATQTDSCDIAFTLEPNSVGMQFALGCEECAEDADLQYAKLLLAAVCDTFEIDEDASVLRLHIKAIEA